MFLGWTSHPEVVAGHWPATLEAGVRHRRRRTQYPLSRADAEALVDYFIDVYAPTPQHPQRSAQLRGLHRRRSRVPDGVRGRHRRGAADRPVQARPRRRRPACGATTRWPRIEPGNRVDRFLAGVAYLDGSHPSAVFARGYYTRTTLVAYDWDGKRAARALVRRQRPGADDEPVQRQPRTAATAPTPSYAHDHHAGRPLARAWPTWTATASRRSSTAAATIDDDGSLLY